MNVCLFTKEDGDKIICDEGWGGRFMSHMDMSYILYIISCHIISYLMDAGHP